MTPFLRSEPKSCSSPGPGRFRHRDPVIDRDLPFRRAGVVVLFAWLTILLPAALPAATVIWSNVGTDFGTGANWTGGVAPADDLTTDLGAFNAVVTTNPDLAASRQIHGLLFASGSGAYTFTGTGSPILTLGAGGILHQDNNTPVFSASLGLALGAAAGFTTDSTGALSIASAVDNAGFALSLGGASTGGGTVSGVITGTGTLAKSGASNTWTLSGANAFTGSVTVTAGTLAVTSVADGGLASGLGASAAAAANLVLDGGILRYSGTSAQTTDRLFTLGAAGASVDSSGAGGNSLGFTGTGSIAFSGIGNRTLTLGGSNTGTNRLDPVLGDSGGNATSVVKSGTGTWTLGAANTYSGNTTVSAGTLVAGHDQAFGTGTLVLNGGTLSADSTRVLANPVTLAANSTVGGASAVTLDGAVTLTGSRTLTVSATQPITVNGVLGESGGAASFTKAGSGTLVLTATNTYTGSTAITGGTLSIGAVAHLGGTGSITLGAGTGSGTLLYTGAADATLTRGFDLAGSTGGGALVNQGTGAFTLSGDVSATAAGTKSFTLSGTGTAANTVSGLVSDGAGTLALVKSAAGTWTLSGANTYTGGTSVTGGTLIAAHDSALGTGTVTLATGSTFAGDGASRTLANTFLLSGGATLGGSTDLSFSSAVTQSTSTTLSVTNTGTTAFSALDLSNSGTNRTLTLAVSGGAVSVSGPVANGSSSTASALVKTGAGSLTLAGANTYDGATTVSGGTLVLSGDNSGAAGNIVLGAGATVRALTSATALGGGSLTLNGGTLQLAADASTDFTRPVTSGGTVAFVVDRATSGGTVTHTLGALTAGSHTLSVQAGANLAADTAFGLTLGAVTLGGTTLTLDVANHGLGTGTLTLGALSNAAARGIAKTGAGTLLLSAASGTITSGSDFSVAGGTFRLGASDALGATALADIVVNNTAGATSLFDLAGFNQSVLTLTFGGTGGTATSVNQVSTGGGTLTLGGTVTYNATGNPLGASLSGLVDLGASTRTFSIADSTNVTGTAAELTVSADLNGTGGLTKSGTGLLLLSGNNAYSGTTTVSAGTVRAATATALGTGTLSLGAGTLQIAADSALNVGRNTTVTANTTVVSDRLTSGSGLTHTLGTLSIGTATLTSAAGTFVTGGTAGLGFGATTFTGNPTFNVASGTQLGLGALSDGGVARTLTKNGAGTLLLSASAASWATAADALVVNAGTVRLGANDAFGTGTNTAVTVRDNVGATALLDLAGYNQSIGNLTLGGTGGLSGSVNQITTGAGTLTLGGTFTSNATGNPTAPWSVSGQLALASGTRTFSIADSTGITGTAAEVEVSAAISGAGALSKTGAGRLLLSGANTYTGTTTVSAGTLRATQASALGSGTLTLAGGTLELVGDTDTAFGRNTTLSGNTTVLVDTATAHAGVTHSLGTLTVSATRTLTIGAGPNVTADTDYGLTFGAVSLAGNPATINIANHGTGTGTLTLGSLSNAAARGITKTGAGTLVLSAASGTLTSGTDFIVNHGTLRLGASGAIGASALADIVVNNTAGGTSLFDLAGFNQSALTLTFGGTGGTATSVNTLATGAGTLTLGGNVTVSATGNPLGATLSGAVNLGAATRTFNVADSTNAAADLTVSANLSSTGGGLTKSGAGHLVLSGTNTQTGTTTLSAGTLTVSSGGTLSSATANLVVNAATLNLDHATQTVGALSSTVATGTVNFGTGHVLTVSQATNSTFSGTLAGAGSLVKAGTGQLTLSGTNTYTGTTSVTAGTLSVNSLANVGAGPSALGAPTTAGAGTIALGSGATAAGLVYTGTNTSTDRVIDLAGTTGGASLTATGNITFTSALTATGAGAKTLTLQGAATVAGISGAIVDHSALHPTSLVKSGTGTWILSGANTFSGPVAIDRGSLAVTSLNSVVGGTASSNLGAPTSVAAGTVSLGNTTFTGTLAYSGSGETTDRVVNLAGTTGGGVIDSSGSGGLTFTANVTVTGLGSKTLTLQGSAAANVFAGIIPDHSPGNLTSLLKSGTGTWSLSGANTYTGTTTVADGLLVLARSGGPALAGNLVLGDGTGADTARLDFSDQLLATASVTFNSSGGTPTLDLNGRSQTLATVATANAAAVIALGSPGSATTFTVGDATDFTYAGLISGGANAAVVKTGAGTATFSGPSTFDGALTVSAGAFSAQHHTALGSTAGTTTVADGASLLFSNVANGNLTVGAEPLSLAGAGLASAGALRNVAGNNSFAGAVTLAAATRLNSDADVLTLSGSVTGSGATLTVGGPGQTTLAGTVSTGGGALVKDGAGTLALNGTTVTVGSTSLQGGTLSVGAGTTFNAGALAAAAGTTLTIASTGLVVADYTGGSTTFSGSLGGAGEFRKTGAGTLVFDHTFTAPDLTLTLTGGTLSLNSAAQVSFGTINITGDTILDFNNSAGTFLSAAHLVISPGITITVNNWIHVSGNPALSSPWFITNTINGNTRPGGDVTGGTPLDQIVFTSYTNLTTTWVSGTHQGWFTNEIRPTPEPAVTGAALLASATGLVLWRRRRR